VKQKGLTLPDIQRTVWQLLADSPGHQPSMSSIADRLDRTYRQFCRDIRPTKHTGRQLRSWCCITYAAHLIGNGVKVEAAMALAGFRNHTHFNERFREYLACLPHEARALKMQLLMAS
jgi:AraC-like DNA-binding protein